MKKTADIVICGAGIAGTALAYHLVTRLGARNVVVVDERQPLTLTSDKGTQGYRNWWPGPDATMLQFVSRSLDILEEIARQNFNAIRMSRRGYLFATASDVRVEEMRRIALQVSSYGMGPLREHRSIDAYQPEPAEGFEGQPDGADLLLGGSATRAFPYLDSSTRAVLHVRRAGWLNAVVLGTWCLNRAIADGATFLKDRVQSVDTAGGRVRSVTLAGGDTIHTGKLVLAAGPLLAQAGRMLGLELPVFHELHAKITFRDTRAAIPRNAPFLIWTDGMQLQWSADEMARFAASPRDRCLLERMPGGVHVRPVDGPNGDELYLIWTYENDRCEPVWPQQFSDNYPGAVMRAVAAMVPAMKAYETRAADGYVDGGYYCKTRENRPLAGPLPVEGAFVCGALSGSGVMTSHAAAELVATHVTGGSLPSYAKWFHPARYEDAAYVALIESWDPNAGQL
jgi:glycine/D-amino acid oxidase-like deaminating enzyme